MNRRILDWNPMHEKFIGAALSRPTAVSDEPDDKGGYDQAERLAHRYPRRTPIGIVALL